MAALKWAKNVWILLVGGFVVLLIILLIIAGISGDGVSKETCEKIDWQGGACRELEEAEFEERFGDGKFEQEFRQAQREAQEP